MKFIISGKNMDVTQGLRDAIEQKLGKLEKYFSPETDIIVTLSVEKDRHKIEVTIPIKGDLIRSEQVSDNMYASIDLVEEIISRQLRKHKTKLLAKHKSSGAFTPTFFEEDIADEEDVKIVKVKSFGIKPMFPEDAVVQMGLTGHDFYVFANADTDEVNVVYKRKNGSYGLIEPEFD